MVGYRGDGVALVSKKTSAAAFDLMMGNPLTAVQELVFQGKHLPSREYVEAVELLELHADWMTDRDGVEVQVINVTTAADLIAEHYTRREL